jgi:hypothetical protein
LPEDLIRNIVVTVDNLPREKIALRQRPVSPIPGAFLTAGSEDDITLMPENQTRYAAFVMLVRNTDARTPAALYQRFEPYFQQAYEELGYPDQSFETRLVEVIDHLIATPDVTGPIKLVQPNVLYQYADPSLEKLSAGQKWLIRMGPTNAAVVKRKLGEVRAELLRE